MRKRHHLLIVLAFLIASATLSAAEPARRDGNWWNGLDALLKSGYAIGFFDGMSLGNDFSMWNIPKNGNVNDPAVNKALESYNVNVKRYLADVTAGQLVDGLNDFYKDYRNRRIKVDRAVWLVVNGIAGTPADKLNEMIEGHRRYAE